MSGVGTFIRTASQGASYALVPIHICQYEE
jgi:hypothetical protein